MASWTNLTTTYIPTEVIDVATWNQLAGYDGNTQYLYETLNRHSLNQYYVYGYTADTSTSFLLNQYQYYDLDYTNHVDFVPDEVDPQFFDEENNAYIKIRKTGLYLIAGHLNYMTENENISQNYMVYQMHRNNVPTDAYATSIQSLPVPFANTQNSPTSMQFFDFQLYNQNDVIYSNITNYNIESVNLPTFIGNNTSFIATTSYINTPPTSFVTKETPTFSNNIVAQSPYFTTVYLTTPSINIEAAPVIFSYTAGYRTEFNSNPSYAAVVKDAWVSYNSQSAGYEDCTLVNSYDTTDNYAKYTPNRWRQSPQTANDFSYVYPLVDVTVPHSQAVFSALQYADQPIGYRYPDYGYIMFSMKSFDIFNAINIHVEQNIFSVHITGIIETAPNVFQRYIIGTPFTFSISKNGASISMWIRLYEKIKQISFSNLTITDECIFGLKIGQMVNGIFEYSPSLIFNNIEVATINSFTTTTTYDMANTERSSGTGAHSIGGVDFYAASGSAAAKRIYSAFYNITNYKFADTSYESGTVTEKQKDFVWSHYLEKYEFSPPNYTYTVSETSSGIYFGTFAFGSTERMI